MTDQQFDNVARFQNLFQAYSQKHCVFVPRQNRISDDKLEGDYRTLDGSIDFTAHLKGKLPSYAAIPLLDDDRSCRFGVIDIDVNGIDLKLLAQETEQLPLCVCQSKSKGAHLYLFVDEPVPAELVLRVLTDFANAIGHPNTEIFPKQTERSNGSIGNAINLPYFGNTRHMVDKNGAELTLESFLDEADKRIINRAYLETVKVKSENGELKVSGRYAGRNCYLNALGYKMIMRGEKIETVSSELHNINNKANPDEHHSFSNGPLREREVEAIVSSLSKVTTDFVRLSKEYAIVQLNDKVHVGRQSTDPISKRLIWNFLSKEGFLLRERNSEAAKKWLRTDVKVFDGLIFDPSSGPIVNSHINLWRGWGIAPQKGDWSKLRNHITSVISPNHGDYVLKWLAWSFQNPSKPAEVAIVLRGARGTGKGMFSRAILTAAGQHGVHVSSAEHITGRFNAHLNDCLFFFVDEAFWAGDKSHEGTLKRIITEPTLMIERKYQNPIMVNNMLKIIIATNEDWAVPAGDGERRFAVFDVADTFQQDMNYFKTLQNEIDNGGVAAMLHDLLSMDLGDFHPRQDVPKTSALNEQTQFSEDAVKRVVRQCLENGILPGTQEEYPDMSYGPSIVAFPNFECRVNEQAFGRTVTSTKIGRTLGKIKGVTKISDFQMFVRSVGDEKKEFRRTTAYVFPPLPEARKAFDPHADWDDKTEWEYELIVESKDEDELPSHIKLEEPPDPEIPF